MKNLTKGNLNSFFSRLKIGEEFCFSLYFWAGFKHVKQEAALQNVQIEYLHDRVCKVVKKD